MTNGSAYLDGGGFSNLDVPLEDGGVHEAELEGGNGHGSWDGAKVEDGLVLEEDEVIEGVDAVGESIEGHLAQGPESTLLVALHVHLLWSLEPVLCPDLLWPKVPLLVAVLTEVAEDVGLLEKNTHRVGEDELVGYPWSFLFGGSKETRETLADETSDVVAVEIVFLDGGEVGSLGGSGGPVSKVGHTGLHFVANIDNDLAASIGEMG